MKFRTAIGLLLIAFILPACGGEVFDYAYTAAGEGNQENDLRRDAQFSTTDDLNVVVKLKPHDETLTVEARFIDTNKDVIETVRAEADSEIGTVVLGIDYEARADQGNEWTRGRYTVEIFLDDEKVETLFFRIN